MFSGCRIKCSQCLQNQLKNAFKLRSRDVSTSPIPKPKLRLNDKNFTAYALLIIPSTAFGLGTWQVQRRQWKLGLIAELEKCLTEPVVKFPENLNDLKNLVYRKVTITGKFDHSGELYMGPRCNLNEKETKKGGGIISSASTTNGFFVITPFIISGSGVRILVNRGWVPRTKIDPDKRRKGQIEDEVTITAVVRDNEKRPPLGMKSDISRRQFFYREVEIMANLTNTEPIFVDADISSTIPGGPIGGQTRVSLRNEHAQYIFTWYGLGVVTFYLWYKRFKVPLRLP